MLFYVCICMHFYVAEAVCRLVLGTGGLRASLIRLDSLARPAHSYEYITAVWLYTRVLLPRYSAEEANTDEERRRRVSRLLEW